MPEPTVVWVNEPKLELTRAAHDLNTLVFIDQVVDGHLESTCLIARDGDGAIHLQFEDTYQPLAPVVLDIHGSVAKTA